MSVKEILEKHGAQRNSYYAPNENPQKQAKEWINSVFDSYEGIPPDWAYDVPEYRFLKTSWKYKCKNSSSLSLALPCPVSFYAIIGDFLQQVKIQCPDFIIDSISIKNGGINIKLDNINDNIKEDIQLLEWELYDYKLLK